MLLVFHVRRRESDRTPNGIRTRATALKGRRPRPLDDEGNSAIIAHRQFLRCGPQPAPLEAWKAYVMSAPSSKSVSSCSSQASDQGKREVVGEGRGRGVPSATGKVEFIDAALGR